MKTAIVYSSTHHGNTKKLLDAIAACGEVDLIDASSGRAELDGYDAVGFASGIYFSKYHESVLSFAEDHLPQGKRVFFLHTAGSPQEKQNAAIKAIADKRGCPCLGTFCCKGFDTFGPFRLIGGIAKGRPNEADMAAAVAFYQSLQ